MPLAVRLLRGLVGLVTHSCATTWRCSWSPGSAPAPSCGGTGRLILPAAIFLLYCAYSVYVGGDAWDGDLPIRANRFVAFVVPLLFVLFNATLNEALAAWRRRRRMGRQDDPPGGFVLAAATVAALLIVNGLWLSRSAGGRLLARARP